jgi:hypothetical protein
LVTLKREETKMSVYGFRDGTFRTKKISIENKVPMTYEIDAPCAISTTYLLEAWNTHTAGTAAKLAKHLSLKVPYPCGLIVSPKVAGTAAHADTLLVKGYDCLGQYTTENIYIKGTATYTTAGNVAWSKIISIECDDAKHKSTDVNVGINPIKIGLPYPVASSADILSYTVGSACATTAPYTFNKTYNTLTNAAITEASKSVRVLFLTKLQ